ncbi:MAG: helix-hairpin-helix domain-containing protein [Bacteroidales bacterium]|nr:helix-hairpin-helix domain-containing protein [Bacteroidales bacterium]
MSKFLREYFSFTNREKKGIIVLLIIIVILLILPNFIYLLKSNEKINFKEFEKEIEAFEKTLNEKSSDIINNSTINYFNFDPNNTSYKDWIKLGMTPKQIKTIKKYISKGGKFKVKADFKKIYCITNEQYKKLAPFIKIKKNDNKTDNAKIILDSLFYFDPNEISSDEWIKLGLNKKQINTIKNYISKGGQFRVKADLKKIYGISENIYKKLEPYIKINNITEKNINKSINNIIVEINSADTNDLIKLKGIGSISANRIIKYRNFLGGFYSTDQLLEVYGISEENFNLFKSNIIVDTTLIKKININTADFKQINKHPYIDYKETKAIINYKNIMKGFKNIEEIKKNNLISVETYNKIKHYLCINN